MGNTVIAGILFQPPSPPNALRFLEDDLLNKQKDATTINRHLPLLQVMKQKNISVNHIWLYSPVSREGNEWNLIPGIHITHTNNIASSSSSSSTPILASQKYTLLYSHGNAEDIGLITAFLIDMARLLQVNIMCYDYSGYGMSVDTDFVCQFFMDYEKELECWKKYRNCSRGGGSGSTMMAQQYGEIRARNGHICRYSRDLFVAPMVHPRGEMTGGPVHSSMKAVGKDEEDSDAFGFTNTCSCNDDTTSGHPGATSSSSPTPLCTGDNGNNPSYTNVDGMSREEYTQHSQEHQRQHQQQLLSSHNWTMPTPSDTNCYANIQTAYDYLTKVERSCPPQHVILYGKSVGSGPTCWLSQRLCGGGDDVGGNGENGMCDTIMCNAETRDTFETGRNDGNNIVVDGTTNRRLAGVVLHSPFLSVIRVVLDVGFTPIGDLFPNIDRVGDFKCPVYVIHGSHDAIVPFYHGQTLFQSLPETSRVVPFWARGAGHNNIEMDMPTAYIKRLQQFIRQCDRVNYPKGSRKSQSQLLSPSSSSSGGSFEEEQTRQLKKLTMQLPSQANGYAQPTTTTSRQPWMGTSAPNITQTSKQRKQKGTLVMRPFHTQIRAPPPPPPPPMNNPWMPQASAAGDQSFVPPGGVGGNKNDNTASTTTTLVLTNNGVHSMSSTRTTTLPHHPSLVLHHHHQPVHTTSAGDNINGRDWYPRSSTSTTARSSRSPPPPPSSSSLSSSSSKPFQNQQELLGNPFIPQPQLQQQQPHHNEFYHLLNQPQQQHVQQRSQYRTLNSA